MHKIIILTSTQHIACVLFSYATQVYKYILEGLCELVTTVQHKGRFETHSGSYHNAQPS